MNTQGYREGRCQRIYLATVFHNGRPYVEAVPDYPYILESYHYLQNSPSKRDLLREYGRKVFLDSGAFSAYTLGATIDVNDYARFIAANGDLIEVASVLDGIGDPQLTLENQRRLEDAGANVLPCFHFGEPEEYLETYLEHYDHITLGGMVPVPNNQLQLWLDHLWSKYLTDDKGWPIVKVHGFGLTAMSLVRRYPWFSVDSSSWVQAGAFGHIVTVTPEGTLRSVPVSKDSPQIHKLNQHYDNMSPIMQQHVREAVSRYGYDLEEIQHDSTERKRFNAVVYASLGTRPLFPFQESAQGLFG